MRRETRFMSRVRSQQRPLGGAARMLAGLSLAALSLAPLSLGTRITLDGGPVHAEDAPPAATAPAGKPAPAATAPAVGAEKPAAEKPADAGNPRLVKLSKVHDIWIDPQRKLLVVDGQVSLREGFLEMFACPKGTKEHESIVSVNSDAMTVHAGLLAIGAQSGGPVKFDPMFTPASGTTIDVTILWTDAAGKQHKTRAQEWVRNSRTKKQLSYDWVFAGSGFYVDEDSGKRYYHADSGDLICVSNFPTATLDLPVESSQANADLQFEAFTERIPPKGTKLRLVLQPRPAAKPAKDAPSEKSK